MLSCFHTPPPHSLFDPSSHHATKHTPRVRLASSTMMHEDRIGSLPPGSLLSHGHNATNTILIRFPVTFIRRLRLYRSTGFSYNLACFSNLNSAFYIISIHDRLRLCFFCCPFIVSYFLNLFTICASLSSSFSSSSSSYLRYLFLYLFLFSCSLSSSLYLTFMSFMWFIGYVLLFLFSFILNVVFSLLTCVSLYVCFLCLCYLLSYKSLLQILANNSLFCLMLYLTFLRFPFSVPCLLPFNQLVSGFFSLTFLCLACICVCVSLCVSMYCMWFCDREKVWFTAAVANGSEWRRL